MPFHRAVLAALAATTAVPAAAQIPQGWTYRLDAPQALVDEQNLDPGEWRYTRMPPGWHVTTTEQGVTLFAPEHPLSERWGIEVELFLFPDPSEAPLGIVVESADAPDGQTQLRFLMRRDGQAALWGRHRGTDSMIVSWTTDTAAIPHTGGVDKYVLRLTHDAGALVFSINGRQMLTLPTGGEEHRAVPGLRIGPGLNVHVSRFDLITPLAPARPRPTG